MPSLSKVREISWRVAEPVVKYDPASLSSRFFAQPLRWLGRNFNFLVPLSKFTLSLLIDIVMHEEEARRKQRAEELLEIISAQSPALIKAGQALASRPDLLPKEYLDSLQSLQDRCPAYPTDQAVALFEEELGLKFTDVFDLETGIKQPVAAASLGQVYKGRLKKNGAMVAIKIQRPNCEESVAIDMFIMRWYASLLQRALKILKRDIDLVSVIDEFGEVIWREMDYRAEAVNAQRFAELYSSIPDVFVPRIYTDLSTSKVLTMEWVDGARLNDKESIAAMGLDSSKFVDILVQCSLRQLLENGFFHCDPHAGNLLAMSNGQLCYLDFGMVSYVEPGQRYSIIEAVVHLVNRDWRALTELYRKMGFIPADVDAAPIALALENALPDVLNAAVGELNFKNVVSKLGDVMYLFPFSLPPYYISIIRCLGVLEGLAIQVDKDFRIISDAYPYIASRLLTDPSAELQSALEQLLFKDGEPRWERLRSLLQEAATTSDYDVAAAVDQLLAYLVSDRGRTVRELLVVQAVDVLDELGTDAAEFALAFAALSLSPRGAATIRGPLVDQLRELLQAGGPGGGLAAGNATAVSAYLSTLADTLVKVATPAAKEANPSPALVEAAATLRMLASSGGVSGSKVAAVVQKVLKDPVSQDVVARVASALGERAATRMVRRVFGVAETGVGVGTGTGTARKAR